MALVAGSVTIADDGTATYVPATVAGCVYEAEIEASDEYTVANGGSVVPDAERVPLLRWYALRSTKIAEKLTPYINANI